MKGKGEKAYLPTLFHNFEDKAARTSWLNVLGHTGKVIRITEINY